MQAQSNGEKNESRICNSELELAKKANRAFPKLIHAQTPATMHLNDQEIHFLYSILSSNFQNIISIGQILNGNTIQRYPIAKGQHDLL